MKTALDRRFSVGPYRVGSTYTFNVKFVPSCVAAFLRRYPTVSVTVLELPVDEVESNWIRKR